MSLNKNDFFNFNSKENMSSLSAVLSRVLPFRGESQVEMVREQEHEKIKEFVTRLFKEISNEPLDKEVYEKCRKQLEIIQNSRDILDSQSLPKIKFHVANKKEELVSALKILPSITLYDLEQSCERRIEDVFFKKIVVLAQISREVEALHKTSDKRSIDAFIDARLRSLLIRKDYEGALEMANIMSDKEMRKEDIIFIIKSFLSEKILQRATKINSSKFSFSKTETFADWCSEIIHSRRSFIEKMINEEEMLQKIEAIAISRELEEAIEVFSLSSIQELVNKGVGLLEASEAQKEKESLKLHDVRKLVAQKEYEEARKIADTMVIFHLRNTACEVLVKALLEEGRDKEAIEVANSIPSELERALLLRIVMEKFVKEKRVKEALEILTTIPKEHRDLPAAPIIQFLIKEKNYKEAREIAASLSSFWIKIFEETISKAEDQARKLQPSAQAAIDQAVEQSKEARPKWERNLMLQDEINESNQRIESLFRIKMEGLLSERIQEMAPDFER